MNRTLVSSAKHYTIHKRGHRGGVIFELTMLPRYGSEFFDTAEEAKKVGENYAAFVRSFARKFR